ncbi:Bicyclomycin resistance protein [Aliiroseovarius sp. xm-m-379]|uniref:multidrug effflux MFS transporter n=1 Tax=unclassified Aliiroseovarius TaxID=2623558 RepID=UPI001568232C|nr:MULTISPECIES: multidrug effflux MFS transporter [unclassified Aliiroseovarius]NRP11267.1 Bicyclomycin resistance protein [Aliiroseovarius sp. xm-d-517]NRP23765.1 Bicyclomycin resistance protein [Aliiroseovarius sp. xm-m-379]NRP28989.1 Bicyclomycin resistance protein [Aliiroseovarius sp. xm-m-314]NRP32564.1 Bicyclomycin resistance protein [Aliiroseovarius sp. xm-a-104]NRP41097.1 Bicyclomycin resistance protein [Aliiroseovarius sp. xm-m-339-2]
MTLPDNTILPRSEFLNPTTPPSLFTLTFVAAMAAVSMNVFLPSLPGMAAYFRADYHLVQLSVALYLFVNGTLQIVVGPLSDRFGRRPVIFWGFAAYILATLGCVMSPTIEVFLGFRMMQATVAVGMVVSRAAIRDMVPGDRAASMIGYVTMGMSLVPMLAPTLGGFLDQLYGWKANFWLQSLSGLLALLLIWRDMGETSSRQFAGFGAQFRAYPALLSSPRFWGYCLTATFTSGAFFAYLGGAPYVGSEIYGMDPARLGLFFGTPAAGYLVGNFLSGRYSTRMGMLRMILGGCLVTATGMATSIGVFALGFGNEYVFFGFMILVGIGNGMTLPSTSAGMMGVRPELAGSAAGLGGTLMMTGGAAISALSGLVLGDGDNAMPLLLLMFLSSVLAVLSMLAVLSRERHLGLR